MDDATVSVDINITLVIVRAAKFNANTNSNGFPNIVGGAANSSTARVNVLIVIRRVDNNNPRARRARVRFRRAISEHVPCVGGQTLNMSSNYLPCSSFLERSTCRAANVSFKGELVAEMNIVASKVGVEVVRVELAYACLIGSPQQSSCSSSC